jgi:bifunctional NMN adenylyltransferase/nudix hydrolase
MKEIEKTANVGIIVGRFQVNNLTDAHIKLVNSVREKHEKVIIFLGISGLSPVASTKRNPLDFQIRKQMIAAQFPDIVISYVKDMKTNERWSKQLDGKITDLISPNQTVMLYGGRDSFIQYYTGRYDTEELEPDVYIEMSGTELREKLKVKVDPSGLFRAGVIWANENQFAHSMAVVDTVVFNEDFSKILLGKRNEEKEYRFFGGFVDNTRDVNYEMTSRRETYEESGVEISDPIYICSKKISDWRYKNEKDKIYTTFFAAKFIHGPVKPGDDIDECRWFDVNEVGNPSTYLAGQIKEILVPEHKILFEELIKKLPSLRKKNFDEEIII